MHYILPNSRSHHNLYYLDYDMRLDQLKTRLEESVNATPNQNKIHRIKTDLV